MARKPLPTWCFALVVVRLGRRFLLVHETKHGQLWYLPAGRVEPGETFFEAARRETLEEAGIEIELEGILRVEHTPREQGDVRMRVVFVAHPATDARPKSHADEHSLEAGFFTLEEIERLPLRGGEVLDIFRYVAQGGFIAPLSMLCREGDPFIE